MAQPVSGSSSGDVTSAELESLRGAATEEAKSRRKDVADQVTIELVRHSVAEEVLVYPQVEKKVRAEGAEHARKEHAEAEETLARMEKLDADDPVFDDELATLFRQIRHHIEDEEGRRARRRRSSIACGTWPRAAEPTTEASAPRRTA